MKRYFLASMAVLSFASFKVQGFLYAKELSFPKIGESMDAVEHLVEGVIRKDSQTYLTVHGKPYFVVTPFFGIKSTQEGTFGPYTKSKRVPLKDSLLGVAFEGGEVIDKKLLLLEGDRLGITVFDTNSHTMVVTRTIAWDRIQPPRDRGGNPTALETKNLRKKFEEKFLLAPMPKFVGMAYDRGKWNGSNGHHFFVATRIPEFPLIILKCEENDPSVCLADRACYWEGKKIKYDSVAGIAVDVKRRELLFADKDRSEILRMNYNSCFHVTRKGRIKIPKKIKSISDLYIDDEDRLWVSSRMRDDYYNASVYTWAAADWR